MAIVKKHDESLRYASYELQNNSEFVMNAVKIDGYELRYASA